MVEAKHVPSTRGEGLNAGPLGETIPPGQPHAVSVSLPTWQDTVGWATRDPAVVCKMLTGYPRFFIHRMIESLSEKITQRFSDRVTVDVNARAPSLNNHGVVAWQAMLFPCRQAAARCALYLNRQADETESGKASPLYLLEIGFRTSPGQTLIPRDTHHVNWNRGEIHAILFPTKLFPLAKAFWQHTGFGISSRYAETCLEALEQLECSSYQVWDPTENPACYNLETIGQFDEVEEDVMSEGALGPKFKIRQRVASSARSGRRMVSMSDVLLYPSGMCAMTNVIDAIQNLRGFEDRRTMVAYGFLYVDTFKVLSKIHTAPAHLYGHCTPTEMDELESQLRAGNLISAIFVEVPGNPLLLTPDILRLRKLADTYDFLIVCDDTVGTSINVDLLTTTDVICTSLTKMFSGGCDTMGGTVLLNDKSKHHLQLSRLLHAGFLDTYYPPDAIVMEKNSRDFAQRVQWASSNAIMLISLLQNHPTISKVYHPSVSDTRLNYDAVRRQDGGGYSFLFSIKFRTPSLAEHFFNALDVAKGPSLGTNFTLACPYTLFAHFKELDWAAGYGVVADLVRVSVGIEEASILERKFRYALRVAEEFVS